MPVPLGDTAIVSADAGDGAVLLLPPLQPSSTHELIIPIAIDIKVGRLRKSMVAESISSRLDRQACSAVIYGAQSTVTWTVRHWWPCMAWSIRSTPRGFVAMVRDK